ncbi:MAG: histidinol-phosphate transaminase [Lentisphaeria bacterium]|nr:histidinol-phosphate transaminase [Lentisphaeria bacterium]
MPVLPGAPTQGWKNGQPPGTPRDGETNVLLARDNIARMEGYTPGEQPRDRSYVKLNTNENPYPPSPRVFEALRTFDPARLRLYSDPLSTALRSVAVAPFGLDPEWALCGNGSDDLLTIAMRTFVDQGAPAAYTAPSYSLYPVLVDLQGARHVVVDLDRDFGLPAHAAGIAAGARLFFVCRPNAPTGNAFPLDAMHRLCTEFPGVVWIDEAYVDFAADSCMDFVRQYPNVVVSRTVSKSYSLAGLRLGIAFAQPHLIREMVKVKDSYNVDMLTQVLGEAALGDRESMLANAARIRSSRDRLSRELVGLGFDVLPSQANFILAKPPRPAAQVFACLRRRGFLVRHFDRDRVRDYLRITIGTDADMTAFVEACRAVLTEEC